ncbi:MAG: DUF3365 domain-containing protein [Xanthomonadales bacterium]|nr:DUF3365 domain-containing protein [Xanthomonadales bacterium]
MKSISMLAWTLALALLPGAGRAAAGDAATTPDADTARAQAAMAELGQSLRTALQAKVAQDGAVAAVAFCHDRAPLIAAEIASKHGVRVGRTSLKQRSPANTPSTWQRAVLDGFAAQVAQGKDPATLSHRSEDGPTLRVAKALKVEAPCLACHGPRETIAPEVARAIAAAYPKDLATGFREGDLRGLIWAEVERSSQPVQPLESK